MSYIRSSSNPEGLYIIFDGRYIEIMRWAEEVKLVEKPTFDEVLRRYREQLFDDEPDKSKCEEKVTEGDVTLEGLFIGDGVGRKYQWRLTSNKSDEKHQPDSMWNWSIDMWEVTLEFIAYRTYYCEGCGEERSRIEGTS